jgi:hypothetical protein
MKIQVRLHKVCVRGEAKYRGERQTGLVELLRKVDVEDAAASQRRGWASQVGRLTWAGAPYQSVVISLV